MSPWGSVLGPSIWEDTLGWTCRHAAMIDYISQLTLEHLGVPLEELVEEVVERSTCISLLRVLPLRPSPDKQKKTKLNKMICFKIV